MACAYRDKFAAGTGAAARAIGGAAAGARAAGAADREAVGAGAPENIDASAEKNPPDEAGADFDAADPGEPLAIIFSPFRVCFAS